MSHWLPAPLAVQFNATPNTVFRCKATAWVVAMNTFERVVHGVREKRQLLYANSCKSFTLTSLDLRDSLLGLQLLTQRYPVAISSMHTPKSKIK